MIRKNITVKNEASELGYWDAYHGDHCCLREELRVGNVLT